MFYLVQDYAPIGGFYPGAWYAQAFWSYANSGETDDFC